VLEYWRNSANKEYNRTSIPRVFVGDPKLVDSATSHCLQTRSHYLAGLTAREFWDPADFTWCQELKSKYQAIRNEFFSVVAEGSNGFRSAMLDFGYAVNGNITLCEHWTRIDLMKNGNWMPMVFPAKEILFAILPPNYSVSWHTDRGNFVLTSHLAIDIPYSGENKCRLEVGDTQEQWINGEMLLFDSSISHRAVNDADRMRVVLIVVVWHPELSEVERQALQFIIDVDETDHDLISQDRQRRRKAEETAAAKKVMPNYSNDTS
jgi:aspartyl/asparaginyl beta-hydroxylase (cupin superfamily)